MRQRGKMFVKEPFSGHYSYGFGLDAMKPAVVYGTQTFSGSGGSSTIMGGIGAPGKQRETSAGQREPTTSTYTVGTSTRKLTTVAGLKETETVLPLISQFDLNSAGGSTPPADTTVPITGTKSTSAAGAGSSTSSIMPIAIGLGIGLLFLKFMK